ncbi:MAG: hypothetical protein H6722_24915 [Sandaracinus sp.]|nr:hypothetical protein [Sandaracinus sp.]MCB9624815.1 hypothetical protein [Sandaracinus sp.]
MMRDENRSEAEWLLTRLRDDARRLHHAAAAGEPEALERLRRLPDLRGTDDEALRSTRRRHALSAVARELGAHGWSHLCAVLRGEDVDDFGEALHQHGHWHVWSASYEEAVAIRAEHGGFLLPYRHQFFVADADYVRELGLDPDDPDWVAIGRDWVGARDRVARGRLFAKLLAARRG